MKKVLFQAPSIRTIAVFAIIIALSLLFCNTPQTRAAGELALAPSLPGAADFLLHYPILAGNCIVDVDGANDKSGQSDMTRLCFDNISAPGDFLIQWNWDERGTTGGNSMDSITFFDSNGDGLVNYAINVTTTGNPATLSTAHLYSCDNSAPARCGSAVLVTGFDYKTVCGVFQESAPLLGDPFSSGSSYPWDTVGYCEIPKSVFPGPVNVLNVCSKTSSSITSSEADCVAAVGGGFITIIKNETPAHGYDWIFSIRKTSDNTLVKSATLAPVKVDPSSPNVSSAQVRLGLAAATYNIEEINAGAYGYHLIAASCKDGDTPVGGPAHPFTSMTLLSGHEIVCEFSNAMPTAVDLTEFSAAALPNAVNLTWTTVSEVNITGFNIYRTSGEDGTWEKVNRGIIPAQNPGQILGASYTFLDESALFGQKYTYRLEMILQGSNSEFSDRISVTPLGIKIFLPLMQK